MNDDILQDGSVKMKQLFEEEILGRYDMIKQLCTIGSVFVALEGKKNVEDYINCRLQFMEDNSAILLALVNCFFRFHGKGHLTKRIICVVEIENGSAGYKFSIISQEGVKKLKKMIGKENIETLCDGCHKATCLDILKKCGNCKDVSYCSRECQKTDWKKHKPRCCVAH